MKVAGVIEAFAFAIVVMGEIWFGVGRAVWTVLLPVILMVFSWRVHRRTVQSLGLAFHDFLSALREWWPAGVLVCGVLFSVMGMRMFALNSLRNASLYFVWSCLQQLALQSMIYLPLRESMPKRSAALVTGLVFAAVHFPNPVLVAGTLLWGAVAAVLFERKRSIWALGLAQVPLSSLLLVLTPYSLNHGFRVGPFY